MVNHQQHILSTHPVNTFSQHILTTHPHNTYILFINTLCQLLYQARTYDHSRIEYAHLDTIMYIDTDELLFCPQVVIYLPYPP